MITQVTNCPGNRVRLMVAIGCVRDIKQLVQTAIAGPLDGQYAIPGAPALYVKAFPAMLSHKIMVGKAVSLNRRSSIV